MKAKSYLNQIKKLDCMIEHKRSEQEQWMEQALSTTPNYAFETDGCSRMSGNRQRMANAVINSIFADSEIEQALRVLRSARQQIISVIEQLVTEEYELLYKIYVGTPKLDPQTGRKIYIYMTLQQAASASDRSYSWAAHLHVAALRNVQRIIDAQQVTPVCLTPKE